MTLGNVATKEAQLKGRQYTDSSGTFILEGRIHPDDPAENSTAALRKPPETDAKSKMRPEIPTRALSHLSPDWSLPKAGGRVKAVSSKHNFAVFAPEPPEKLAKSDPEHTRLTSPWT